MKELLRTSLSCIGSGYHHLRQTRLVWWHLLNREARRRYQAEGFALSFKEASLVKSLSDTGIAVTHAAELFPAELFEELRRYAQARWEHPDIQAVARERIASPLDAKGVKKSFLVNLWDPSTSSGQGAQDKPVLDLTHPFIRLSLSHPALRVVNAYLRMLSKFRAWRLEATVPTPAALRPRASQRWHRDEEDRKLVKVFLYLSDVDESAGPFMYLQHSQGGGKWQKLFPAVPPRGSLKMPPNEDAFIPKEDVVVCLGKAGTLIFCDTTGLHKGGFAAAKHRLMYTSVYTSSASPWPIRYTYPLGFEPRGLAPAARFAVHNDPNQREPRFYR